MDKEYGLLLLEPMETTDFKQLIHSQQSGLLNLDILKFQEAVDQEVEMEDHGMVQAQVQAQEEETSHASAEVDQAQDVV